jgi:hypothetical protein
MSGRLLGVWSLSAVAAALGCSGSDPSGAGGTPNGGAPSNGGATANGGSTAGAAATGGSTIGGSAGVVNGAGGSSASGGAAGGIGGGNDGDGGVAGGGTGGNGGTPPGIDDCPEPPAGSSAEEVEALNAVNTRRVAMGLECMELVPEISVAAQLHCEYYAANADEDACTGNAHAEVDLPECEGFVAANFSNRLQEAGYDGQPRSEVMAFTGMPERAVTMFVDSVWHRTPLLSPWIREMGYGGTTTPEGCDTIDLGRGPETPNDVTALFPYPGQTDVRTDFDGSREGPEPPEPPTGWPSGYPVHVYVRGVTAVLDHRIDVDGTDEPLPHVWIEYGGGDGTNGNEQLILYPHAPLEPATTYRVRVSVERGGEPLDFDWTFTTRGD